MTAPFMKSVLATNKEELSDNTINKQAQTETKIPSKRKLITFDEAAVPLKQKKAPIIVTGILSFIKKSLDQVYFPVNCLS